MCVEFQDCRKDVSQAIIIILLQVGLEFIIHHESLDTHVYIPNETQNDLLVSRSTVKRNK